MSDVSPLDDKCRRVLKAIVELAEGTPHPPHLHVLEVAARTDLPERAVEGCLRVLEGKYIDVVDHLPIDDPGGLTVMGVTEEGHLVAKLCSLDADGGTPG